MKSADELIERLDKHCEALLAAAEARRLPAVVVEGVVPPPAVTLKDEIALGEFVMGWLLARPKLAPTVPKEEAPPQESKIDKFTERVLRSSVDRTNSPASRGGGASQIKLRTGEPARKPKSGRRAATGSDADATAGAPDATRAAAE